ncbi:hypothetical protein K493DRAFT_278430 [Basidiobolus meristosporus CBS 931.73]|uniref:THIF-type NAD/FAD binding fold domain-containing protein n=1 Tax=Basidiobolus meristosporus CBS 931.73 TaxID=1314790 RepID=A0A1Y1YS21_9FUNG|nr:hypothetical protein K493DRAFT_278430 [Basidiobolus meristosporus CBS 931.73]|eukprot:ORY00830.1 hypothetical protein K493DRAFT_278430 [Basidiobolus meristosporus CBS 931.73]
MSFNDWKLPSILLNPKVQLTLTAVTASLTTAAFILASQNKSRKQHGSGRKATKKFEEVPLDLRANKKEVKVSPKALSEKELSLLEEQFSKNAEFFGQIGQEKLRKSFVIVVGAGGVGSWAALMLLRSGVERMRIIDFDQVTLSSLNRHAVATRADVGTPKVQALKKHFEEILPHADIDARVELFKDESAEALLEGCKPDFVLDCIDNIDTKLHLLKYCHENNIPVISSMGAGAKADPSKVQISDISETFEDSLARAVRKKIRKLGVEKGIPVVYSTEKPGEVKLLPLEQSQEDKPDEFAVLPDFRVRILPVLGTLPAIFGMAMASYVACKLADHEIQPLAIKHRDSVYARILRDLLTRETKNYKIKIDGLPFDKRDVGYLVEEVWRGRSVISGDMEKLALSRWDNSKPLSFQNCVCMTKSEAKAHEKIESNPEEHYPKEIVESVRLRLKEESILGQWR